MLHTTYDCLINNELLTGANPGSATGASSSIPRLAGASLSSPQCHQDTLQPSG